VDLALNMVLFLAIAMPVWAVFRNRAPKVASAAIISWLLFYVSLLNFLFPATDGPSRINAVAGDLIHHGV
jgi:hypothetical protein